VLLLRRSANVGSYAGRWGAVAGHAEGDPDAAARQEIAEETGLPAEAVALVRRGDSFPVDDPDRGTRWVVHPYLFDTSRRDVTLNWESDAAEWVSPTAILTRETVPNLWTSYDRVAPTVAAVAEDTTHGAATLSVRALEVLRDHAARLAHGVAPGDAPSPSALARRLRAARPSMAVLQNRVNRVMHAARPDFAPAAVHQQALAITQQALDADTEAAQRAATKIAGRRVLTLSRSGTARQALLQAEPAPSVVIAASEPGGEGVGVAETLADHGLDVTLIADAAIPWAVDTLGVEAVLMGADTIEPDGAVVNKIGTRVAALAAQAEGVPCYAVAAADKVSPAPVDDLEHGAAAALYDGPAPLAVQNPTFERTPARLVTGVITERGVLDSDALAPLADEHAARARWVEEAPGD
jgi:translation initiation factor 2B subunit (eIF-2B alpha/beta/delta family)